MAGVRVPPAVEEDVLGRLDVLETKRPELTEAIAFYRGALPVLRVATGAVLPFKYSPEAAQRKLTAGVPLLIGEELPFDVPTLLALFGILCRVAEAIDDGAENPVAQQPIAAGGEPAHAAAEIRQVAEQGEVNLPGIAGVVPAGDMEQIAFLADRFHLDEGLLVLLIQTTLKPTLQVWVEALEKHVDFSGWGKGLCPVCGCGPVLSEVNEETGTRHLRCGMCSARWPYPPVQCTFCGNDDAALLRFFSTGDEDEQYYVEGCRRCGAYVKTVHTPAPLMAERLITEDLATRHLDALAVEQGYTSNPEF